MTDRRFIKPTGDLLVPREDGRALPPHGGAITWSSYWQRRLNAGEIEATDEASVTAGDAAARDAAAEAVAGELADENEESGGAKPARRAARSTVGKQGAEA